MLTRRSFIKTTAATAALTSALVPFRLSAETRIGSGTLRSVSDGHLVLPRSFALGNLPEAEAVTVLESNGLDPDNVRAPCNLALWQSGDHTVLFDAGSGPDFMPSAGAIQDSLAALDLSPDDITHVAFTHGHPDHLWGVLDDFDEPLFWNAQHLIGDEEHAYWTDPNTVETITPARQGFAVGARRRLEAVGDGLTLFGSGDEIVPGLSAVATPGHTPGHMAFRISDGGASALIVGDAIANGHLALARPDWPSPADNNAELGLATRMALLEDLSASGEMVLGFHLPSGGIGSFSAGDGFYSFTPA